MKCRHCNTLLQTSVLDLIASPPSNAYLDRDGLSRPEKYFPLRVLVCEQCWLVQTEDFADADELFTEDYGYFSSTSKSWLEHCARFVGNAVQRFNLDADSLVCEVAANDGYLLQYVAKSGVPCFGVEPTHSTAEAARQRGIEIVEQFFGEALGKQLASAGKASDLTIANNVLAHVPDINDFAAGFREILKPTGVSVFEAPHLLRLMQGNQFDTIYHEHFSYLSLTAVRTFFAANGLTVFDVEELPTHGGSLRIFAQRTDTGQRAVTESVARIIKEEEAAGITSRAYYLTLQGAAERVKDGFVAYLIEARKQGLKVGAYGAAAKGNTLMNFAGIKPDLLPYVVDLSPGKQGRWMPGSHIPIVSEDYLRNDRPDRIVILPWNLKTEISGQLDYARNWGAKFVVAIPELTVF